MHTLMGNTIGCSKKAISALNYFAKSRKATQSFISLRNAVVLCVTLRYNSSIKNYRTMVSNIF